MQRRKSALLVLFTLACASPEMGSVEPMVLDSSGVAVVTHADIREAAELDQAGAVRLGAENEADGGFYRVSGGVLLADDRVAIANSGSSELLFFSVDGQLIGRFGGEGQGPEEFSNLFWIQGMADGTVVASDPGNARLVRVSPTAELVGSQPIRFQPEAASPDRAMLGRGFVFGATSSGEVLAVPWARAVFSGSERPLPLRGELRRYDSELADFVAIDSVRLRTWFEQVQAEGPPITQALGSPLLVFSANHDWIAYSEGATHRVTVLKDGVVDYIIQERRSRLPFRPDSIPPGYHHAADSLPAYTDLVVDSQGRIWVQTGTPASADTSEWHVFSDRGTRARLVRLPVTTSVLDARGEQLLLLERDAFDVERIVILRWPGAF